MNELCKECARGLRCDAMSEDTSGCRAFKFDVGRGDALLEILQSAQSTIMQFADILSNHPENEDMLCSDEYKAEMERLEVLIKNIRKCL